MDMDTPRTKQGRHVKIPQTGIVQIDDDVEIGANATVDRATFGRTWIKRGTKIDNLVMIAHNVVVGEDSLLVAQVGISGSTRLGNHVVLAGQVGVAGHLEIGDRVKVARKPLQFIIPSRPTRSLQAASLASPMMSGSELTLIYSACPGSGKH